LAGKKSETRRKELNQQIEQLYSCIESIIKHRNDISIVSKRRNRDGDEGSAMIHSSAHITHIAFAIRFHVLNNTAYTFDYINKPSWRSMIKRMHGIFCSQGHDRMIKQIALDLTQKIIEKV
jgi:hypothetical protein